MKPFVKANLFFFAATAIWGLTFPLIKNVLHQIDPLVFVSLRFILASVVLLVFLIPSFKNIHWGLLKAGFILGVLNSACYGFQTVSLKYISASRCAFITGIGVVLVPIFSALFKISVLRPIEIFAGLLCLLGLYFLTGANLSGLNQGDFLAFLCAIAWALSVVYLQKCSEAHYSASLLSFFQILFTVPIPFLMSMHRLHALDFSSGYVFSVLIFCGIFATIFPMFLQARYQRDTTATQTALIFALEPVFATAYSCLFFNEVFNRHLLIGGVFILLSILLPSVRR